MNKYVAVRNVTASSLRRLRTPLGPSVTATAESARRLPRWSNRLETRFASGDDPVWTLSGGQPAAGRAFEVPRNHPEDSDHERTDGGCGRRREGGPST